jgi:hypothetical protein
MFYGVINESKNLYKRPDISELRKYRGVIVGEIHSGKMISYYKSLINTLKPEYFISELAHEDIVLSQEELKDRLDKTTNGEFLKNIPDYQDNYEIYKLAYDCGVKLIGCDLENDKFKNADDEMKTRESFMLSRINKYSKHKFICQLGDFHLRSIPIDEDFCKVMKQSATDDTGNRGYPIYVHFASSIWNTFHNSKDIIISREPGEYNRELEYLQKKEE